MKFGIKVVLKLTSFLIGFYIIFCFVFNPRILILLIPPILIIGFLLFIMYKFARPQFDKLVNFSNVKELIPTVRLIKLNGRPFRDFVITKAEGLCHKKISIYSSN